MTWMITKTISERFYPRVDRLVTAEPGGSHGGTVLCEPQLCRVCPQALLARNFLLHSKDSHYFTLLELLARTSFVMRIGAFSYDIPGP